MRKLVLLVIAFTITMPSMMKAGGLLTNTNQNLAFYKSMAREGAIAIDGVYSNPAGVVFLPLGMHLSLNIQSASQTRTATTTFGPFIYGVDNNSDTKEFKGKANVPFIPSIQAAYNTGKWSFQFGFAFTGGGGKCTFDNGLGSFESVVAMLPLLSQNMDALSTQMGLGALGLPAIQKYDVDMYLSGKQYYMGFTFGAAYKVTEKFSVYGGVRLLYGTSHYNGYVKNIQVDMGNGLVSAPQTFTSLYQQASSAVEQYTAAAQQAQQAGNATAAAQYAQLAKEYTIKAGMLGTLGTATQDVTLDCKQTGIGIAPIIGLDYNFGDFNIGAKYEFRTKMTLKNKATSSESANNLSALAKYRDGAKVREDSPALLTLGVQYSGINKLRLNAGLHYYFDKQSKQYNDMQEKLDKNTIEYLIGAEYDINKRIDVGVGAQLTRYGMTDDYISDVSFNVNSYSIGVGLGYRINDKLKVNIGYFQTNYENYNRETQDYNNLSKTAGTMVGNFVTKLAGEASGAQAAQIVQSALTTPDASTGKSLLYGADSFTRTNRVFAVGIDIDF